MALRSKFSHAQAPLVAKYATQLSHAILVKNVTDVLIRTGVMKGWIRHAFRIT